MAQKLQQLRSMGLFLFVLCVISVVIYSKGAPKFHDSPYQFYYQSLHNYTPLDNVTVALPSIGIGMDNIASSVHNLTVLAAQYEPLTAAVSYGMRSLNISGMPALPREWNDGLRNITDSVQDWAEEVQDLAEDWWLGNQTANHTANQTA